MKFQVGNTFGKGRPQGAKDRKWNTLRFWMEKLENEWNKITPKDRAYISIEAWKTLVKRIPLPPDTPEESLENASKTFKELENARRSVLESSGYQIGLDDRGSPVQVQADSGEVQPSLGASQETKA